MLKRRKIDGGLLLRDFFLVTKTLPQTQPGKNPKISVGNLEGSYVTWKLFRSKNMSRKDANKPKGRTTAYAYFVMSEKEQYAKVCTEHNSEQIRAEHNFFVRFMP